MHPRISSMGTPSQISPAILPVAIHQQSFASTTQCALNRGRRSTQRPGKSPVVILLLILLIAQTGCSVLRHYPKTFRPARFSAENGNIEQALLYLEPKTQSGLDRLCYLLESGTLLHTTGRWQESIETFGGFYAEVLKEPIQWQNGYIIPPTKPGLGIELARQNPFDPQGLFALFYYPSR